MSGAFSIRTCEECGIEYVGGSRSRLCPDCRRRRIKEADKNGPSVKKGDGWRNMFRDESGAVIRAGGNVMDCLKDLCSYEEICEAAGIPGPEALRAWIQRMGKPEAPASTPAAGLNEKQKREIKTCKDCGGEFLGGPLARFCPDCRARHVGESARRRGLGKLGAAARWGKTGDGVPEASDKPQKAETGRAPEWVGPSAELLREETRKEKETTC